MQHPVEHEQLEGARRVARHLLTSSGPRTRDLLLRLARALLQEIRTLPAAALPQHETRGGGRLRGTYLPETPGEREMADHYGDALQTLLPAIERAKALRSERHEFERQKRLRAILESQPESSRAHRGPPKPPRNDASRRK